MSRPLVCVFVWWIERCSSKSGTNHDANRYDSISSVLSLDSDQQDGRARSNSQEYGYSSLLHRIGVCSSNNNRSASNYTGVSSVAAYFQAQRAAQKAFEPPLSVSNFSSMTISPPRQPSRTPTRYQSNQNLRTPPSNQQNNQQPERPPLARSSSKKDDNLRTTDLPSATKDSRTSSIASRPKPLQNAPSFHSQRSYGTVTPYTEFIPVGQTNDSRSLPYRVYHSAKSFLSNAVSIITTLKTVVRPIFFLPVTITTDSESYRIPYYSYPPPRPKQFRNRHSTNLPSEATQQSTQLTRPPIFSLTPAPPTLQEPDSDSDDDDYPPEPTYEVTSPKQYPIVHVNSLFVPKLRHLPSKIHTNIIITTTTTTIILNYPGITSLGINHAILTNSTPDYYPSRSRRKSSEWSLCGCISRRRQPKRRKFNGHLITICLCILREFQDLNLQRIRREQLRRKAIAWTGEGDPELYFADDEESLPPNTPRKTRAASLISYLFPSEPNTDEEDEDDDDDDTVVGNLVHQDVIVPADVDWENGLIWFRVEEGRCIAIFKRRGWWRRWVEGAREGAKWWRDFFRRYSHWWGC